MPGWQLGALLHELRAGRLHDVSDQVAGASDYLWTDAQLVRYINEACRRFARRSLVIRDNTTAQCTQFSVVGLQQQYTLDPSVIAVLSVRGGVDPVSGQADTSDLARAGHDGFDTYHTPDAMFFNVNQLENLGPGKPLAYDTDESILADPNGSFSVMNLRLYPQPDTPWNGMPFTMRVIREPINDLTIKNLEAYPEIPASHHLDMIDWAAYLALSNVDTDIAGGDAAGRADKFAARFEQHCQDARKEVMRKLFTPLQWGFGNNGWTWET